MKQRRKPELSSILPFVLCSVFMMAVLASAALAGTIDFVNDFPSYQGQGGFAAYSFNGFTATPYNGDGFRLLTTGSPGMFYTPEAGQGSMPFVEKIGMPDLVVLLCPSAAGAYWGPEWATLTYTASFSGDFSFAGSFKDASGGKTTTKVYLFKNTDWAHPIFTDTIQSGHLTAAFNVASLSLKRGDKISFAVNANGNDQYDFTQLTGTMRSIATADLPEPTAFAALVTGLVGLLAIRRRK